MPELPEVETIKNQLQEKIAGKAIKRVEVNEKKMVKGISIPEFKTKIEGVKIKGISRRAKLLIIQLENNLSLLIHLKLTGQLIFHPFLKEEDEKVLKSARLVYYFNDGSLLLHNDLRQFGFVKLMNEEEFKKFFLKEKFGPEPLEKEFSFEKFKEILAKKRRRRIKPLLMDQKFLAGVGNVYANEACFCASLNPTRVVKDLKDEEIKRLYHCLLEILKEAIKYKGTSADAYVDASGRRGNYLLKLKIYGRESEKCFRCQGKIKRIVLFGRGTFYCPKCQK